MGELRDDQKHRVVLEVNGKTLKNTKKYVDRLRTLIKGYGVKMVEKKKVKIRKKKKPG